MRKLKPREPLTLLFPTMTLRIPFLLFMKIKSLKKTGPELKRQFFISKLYNNSFHKGKCQSPCTVHAPMTSFFSSPTPLLLARLLWPSLTSLASSFSSSEGPLNCCLLYLETNSPIYLHHQPPSNPCLNVMFSMRSCPPLLNATTYLPSPPARSNSPLQFALPPSASWCPQNSS